MPAPAVVGGLRFRFVSNKKKPLIASGTSLVGLLLIFALLTVMRRRGADVEA